MVPLGPLGYLSIWPAGMVWPDPETITSLIEAHGTDPGSILRPHFARGRVDRGV